ncbi:hypothetical protein L7F22_036759 [Adiantum nelumboides]|nr:hypothetical protein [Adiantum nelumboides]
MYAMVSTRPDIAFAVGVVNRYMANPSKKHWEAVKHVLRYLKGSTSKCLHFGNNDTSIVRYTDSDYAGCVDTKWLCLLICWSSCVMEILSPKLHDPECNCISKELSVSLQVKTHRGQVSCDTGYFASKCIELAKVHTDDNPADVLTKSLSLERFAHCIKMMGVG